MPSLAVLNVFMRELLTRERTPRIPEPDLVMETADSVDAFTKAGCDENAAVMAPVYLYHAAQICDVIQPGDQVLDLGCGPANQLAMVAQLNPDIYFTGIDLSKNMLTQARQHIRMMGLNNVDFKEGDFTNLSCFAMESVDAVFSTMTLHHLPDTDGLMRTFSEIARVLKPGGGLYIVDFGHLKARKSIEYFAYQYADRQPEEFTRDYLNSLYAAFRLEDFDRAVVAHLSGRARIFSTFRVPYMVAVKSPHRSKPSAKVMGRLRTLRKELPAHHQRDLKDLSTFFRLGGLRNPLLP